MSRNSFRELQSKFQDPMIGCAIRALVFARVRIEEARVSKDEIRGHESVVGHHSITLAADKVSNAAIMDVLSYEFPDLRFISEEDDDDPRRDAMLVKKDDLPRLRELSMVAIVDPICGTAGLQTDHYEVSISIGIMHPREEKLVFIGGAAFAPNVHGGMLIASRAGQGVFVAKGIYTKTSTIEVPKPLKRAQDKRYIEVGPDIFIMPRYSRFLLEFSRKVRTTNTSGSCPLGIMKVIAGMTDAFVQPHQKVVDWAGMYPALIEAGGAWIFYHYREGFPVRMEEPDILSFAPGDERNTAFIAAGSEECAEWLWSMLLENWNQSVIP